MRSHRHFPRPIASVCSQGVGLRSRLELHIRKSSAGGTLRCDGNGDGNGLVSGVGAGGSRAQGPAVAWEQQLPIFRAAIAGPCAGIEGGKKVTEVVSQQTGDPVVDFPPP